MGDVSQLREEARRATFHAVGTTRTTGGPDAFDSVGSWTSSFGTRALVLTGVAHAREQGLIGRIERMLRGAGVAVELFEGIDENPTVGVVDAGALLARTWRADVVVAIGGGSVIDVAKAVAASAAQSEHASFRTHLSGIREPSLLVTRALPVVAVPTLPGAGSETNGTSVVTDEQTGRKLSAHSDAAAPRVAVLDPFLARDAPAELLGSGFADAFCHALEAALSVRADVASDGFAEQAMRVLLRTAPNLLEPDCAHDTFMAAWWATNLAGQALSMAGSVVTHPLAHPLSARYGLRHGEVVAAIEPAVLAMRAEQLAGSGHASRVAAWLDVRGSGDGDAAIRGIHGRLAKLCAALGVRLGLHELGVRLEHVPDVIADALASGSRGLAALPGGAPEHDELDAILALALRVTPVAPTRQVWKLRDELAPAL